MYRPPDWKNHYKDLIPHLPLCAKDAVVAYEAGADAMLKGILENGLKVKNMGDFPRGKGTVIFIPEQ